jgi:hypothetical protein
MNDFVECDVWHIGIDDGPMGVRVIRSYDVPGAWIMQIQGPEGTISARVTPDVVGELHRQAMAS